MSTLKGKSALVVGASSGVGRATLLALAAQGARVCAVARNRERLERIAREAAGEVIVCAGDATQPELAERLIAEYDPELVVVALGVQPKLGPLDQQTWQSFSEVWEGDVKATFHLAQQAIRKPLKPGSVFVILSSGAAIAGSPLSGGYAAAKRMQWLMSSYLQKISDQRKLGLRFVSLLPKQLIVGTAIGDAAAGAYAQAAGVSQQEFMARFGSELVPEGVADVILKVARGEIAGDGLALAVTGKGVEVLS